MKDYIEILKTDVLVIGSGIAGLVAAAGAASGGKRVIVVSKGRPGKACNTVLAGGGFRCATEAYPESAHLTDTLNGGKGINDRELVTALVRGAPSALASLVEMGMPGVFQEKGFHTRVDTLVGGPSLIPTLIRMCIESGVRFTDGVVITDLLIEEGTCFGASGLRRRKRSAITFRAPAVILATGGGGGLFQFNDNAPGSYGEGYALALDAGLELVDMEFTQFYPLIRADCGSRHMLLPAVFADSARITNRLGEDLKEKYNLFSRPIALVMRDRFSRAVFKEIKDGNGVDGAVFMDMRSIDATDIALSSDSLKRFEKILDFRREPVKIRPAAHFTMGGIKTDTEGRTALGGLYAVGEAAGGAHGANRLGGNALSEAAVFGRRCGKAVLADAALPRGKSRFAASVAGHFHNKPAPVSTGAGAKPPFFLKSLGEILWNKAGIIRSDASLKETLAAADMILEWSSKPDSQSSEKPLNAWSLRAAALVARAMAVSAIERTESRGAHYREDFPEESESWVRNIYVATGKSGLPEISRIEPVV